MSSCLCLYDKVSGTSGQQMALKVWVNRAPEHNRAVGSREDSAGQRSPGDSKVLIIIHQQEQDAVSPACQTLSPCHQALVP